YEELIRRRLDYKIVWLVNRKNISKLGYPDNARVVSINTPQGIKEVYSSKIWLDNGIAFSNHFDKKEGQIHIQTMHGSLGIKRLDNAVICRNERGEEGQRVVKRESNETDYVITNSQFEEDVFHTVFWKNTPMVRLGHARTDILFETDQYKIQEIREDLLKRYGIPVDKKLVLYAPTHRKGMTIEDLSIDYKDMVDVLQEKFGDEYVVMIRMHKRTKNIMLKNVENDDHNKDILFDVTNYPDIQELMLVTSIGITDYSSWIYDYVLTRKPGFIFATDLERYNNNTGLYYPLEETPFPVCKSHEELVKNIREFDSDYYVKRVEEFLEEKQAVDDGHAAERIVDWIQTLAPIK
ncbi:MAG: CDP-glycerol glycerophosphotransferase family protein, partial [Lachnospiraceae bacterium]|nr:CDP-glycerol glycerophosphotransferase family protein [Lachnospiraceae bacterium]